MAPKRPSGKVVQKSDHKCSLLLPIFIVSIFTSAVLLFAVEPMFTKMVLPQLGGSASVWSMAMASFQIMLLAGYAYAHFLTRFTSGWKSVAIHLVVMLAAFAALPLHIASGWGPPPKFGEEFWLLGLFAASIALPFFALAANGPLLQAWFVGNQHPASKNPYFLYAASNAGSFLGLLSYPVLVEPFIRLRRPVLVLDDWLLCPGSLSRKLRHYVPTLARPGTYRCNQ